jgi:hypothetical protein
LDDLEYYFEPSQQYHLESFDQGKYNTGLSLLPIHQNDHTYACAYLDNLRDYNLVLDVLIPCQPWVCIWVAIASA